MSKLAAKFNFTGAIGTFASATADSLIMSRRSRAFADPRNHVLRNMGMNRDEVASTF